MAESTSVAPRIRRLPSATRVFLPLAAFVALLVYPRLPMFSRPSPQHLVILILIYVVVSTAWNILAGFAGQVSFGHSLYFGIGAYTSTMLMMKLNVTPWLGLVVGGLVAVLFSLAVGYPTFRLEGRHFSIATMALPEIVVAVMNNWKFVNEAIGLFLPMKSESFVDFQFHSSKLPYYYIILSFAVISIGIAYYLENTRPGYYFKAIRENPTAARSLGINIARYKQLAGAVSAFLTAAAGTFYAQYVLYISPDTVFKAEVSILVVLTCGLGGMGTLWGPVVGSFVLIPIAELTRIRWGGGGRAVHLVAYGLLIMLIAVFQPEGLLGWVASVRGRLRRAVARGEPSDEKVRRADSE